MAATGSGKKAEQEQQQEEKEEEEKEEEKKEEEKGTAGEETERGEVQLRAQLARLQADNDQLRRQVQLLQQSSDLLIPDPVKDGPFLHVLYMDGTRSTYCQAELEGILLQLMQQSGGERDPIPSQPSSVVLGNRTKGKDTGACIKVVSNVRYYRSFCLDSIGRPLLRGNPAITEGWNIPQYQTIFKQILSNEISEGQAKPQRPKGICFNCGSEDHIVRTCPQKRDLAGINLRRRQFESFSNSPKSRNPQRYHNEQEERFAHFKPGVISEGLRLALAVAPGQLPPYIYRMRQLDYPPGWLRESCQEGSGITIHGDLSDGEIDELEEAEIEKQKRKAFNPTKLISYPGFNVPLPPNTLDDWRTFNSCPMQPQQLKEAMILRLKEASKKVKRTAPAEQGAHTTKKRRSRASDGVTFDNSDMETDSEPTSREAPAWPPLPASPGFRAPLPPSTPTVPRSSTGGPGGSPTAPPLPPDVTPPPLPKDTPPPSPATPGVRSRVEAGAPEEEEEEEKEEEEALSLEDLEEQQRLIQAALEQSEGAAEGANDAGDVKPGGVHPAAPSRPWRAPAGVRRSPRVKVEREGGPSVPCERREAPRGRSPSAADAEPSAEPSPESPGEPSEEPSPGSPAVAGGEGGGGLPGSVGNPPKAPALDEEMAMVFDVADDDDEAEEKAEAAGSDDEAEAVPWRVKNAQRGVPDSSKFAAGITDFSHHLEESGQPTGLYARLRSVLQRAPRKAAKKP
uniref:Zinc finger CCHC domain-containing protein 8 n=1 Tax=Petromyzon marinus TaxID=7757 RepID=A0AAJ7T2U7_PETMA|nr:zinc finger CCHC domain-containing protein 8 isoform X2 [Petromyzon marinus]